MKKAVFFLGISAGSAFSVLNWEFSIPNPVGPPYQELPKLPYESHPNSHFISKIPKKIGIIGGGLAGLVTAKILKTQGYEIEILEKQSTPGGVWSENYDEAGLQFAFRSYYLPDDPIKNAPMLPKLDYLQHWINEDIIKKFNLLPLLHCDANVTSIRQNEDESWQVNLSDGKSINYDFLVLCAGLYNLPNIPKIKGEESFKGKIIHSSKFINAKKLCEGKNVVVIGGLRSAYDISNIAAKNGGKVINIQRRVHWTKPYGKKFFGINIEKLLFTRFGQLFLMPVDDGFWLYNYCKPLVNWFYKQVEKKFKEDLPEFLHPDLSYASSRSVDINIRDEEIIKKYISGEIKHVKGTVNEITPDGVIVGDNHYKADLIVYATGFQFSTFGIEQEEDGTWMYRHTIIPGKKNLAVIGMFRNVGACLGFSIQACWLAEVLRGKVALPGNEEMKNDIAKRKKIVRKFIRPCNNLNTVAGGIFSYDPFMRDMGLQIRRQKTLFKHYFGFLDVADYKAVITHRV
ncbi:unnamed protein product [Blepharisma stoltei]|uniref:Flavin-containing monooxygenase n=1 Tax=Blepharisma stoltei TaxID=1481888 RepID=A0AAU9JBS3_9CILI|nr:unnamed protein product [Blepharisma stoltei]